MVVALWLWFVGMAGGWGRGEARSAAVASWALFVCLLLARLYLASLFEKDILSGWLVTIELGL